ncbi:MAG TPA: hypothetical protein VJ719_05580, partial [Chthoniobacterales bacterium]|nr:hypothetical protein [Chthoniobacterales bacterium]
MTTEPPPLPGPANRKAGILLLGIAIGNIAGGILMAGLLALVQIYRHDQISNIVAPNLLLVPLVVGLVASWFWRDLNRTIGQLALDALWATLVALAGGAIFLREGVICLLMCVPVLYVLIFAGMLLGRWWFRHDRSRLRIAMLPLVLVIALADSSRPSNRMTQVSDEILIRAPVGKVWPHVLEFPNIPDKADYWLFRIGLPYPTETTNGGNFVGADRRCIFSDGIVIKETVAEFLPNEKLTFDIVEQPTHPEVYGHITLHRGQFVLRDNGNNTTTLTGSSWYTLHVRPRWYFDLWAR